MYNFTSFSNGTQKTVLLAWKCACVFQIPFWKIAVSSCCPTYVKWPHKAKRQDPHSACRLHPVCRKYAGKETAIRIHIGRLRTICGVASTQRAAQTGLPFLGQQSQLWPGTTQSGPQTCFYCAAKCPSKMHLDSVMWHSWSELASNNNSTPTL